MMLPRYAYRFSPGVYRLMEGILVARARKSHRHHIIFESEGDSCEANTTSGNSCEFRQMSGKLLRITYPGPPNDERVEQDDEAEVYWVLCADDATNWGDQAQMQLLVQAGMYKTHRLLIHQRVHVNGPLLFAETSHHPATMMIGVGKLEAE